MNIIEKRFGLDNFTVSLNTFKTLTANTRVSKDSQGNFIPTTGKGSMGYSNTQLAKDLNEFAVKLMQHIDSDLAKAISSNNENQKKKVFEELNWINQEFELALAGKGKRGGLQGLLETYKGDHEVSDSLFNSIDKMKSRLGSDLEAIKKNMILPVKGLKLNNFIDIQEFYTTHLLPQKTQLSNEEFSKRGKILLDQAVSIAREELRYEMKVHRVVLTDDNQLLNAKREKPEWLSDYEAVCQLIDASHAQNYVRTILNNAIIENEMEQLTKPDSLQEFIVANWLYEAAVKKDLPSGKHYRLREAQVDAILKFMKTNWKNMPVQDLREQLIIHKRNAIFTESDMPPQDQQKCLAILDYLEQAWKNMQEQRNELLLQKMASSKLPPLARENIKFIYKKIIEKFSVNNFKEFIALCYSDPSILQKIKNGTFDEIDRPKLPTVILQYNIPQENFYLKWAHCLKAEMIQGRVDPGEDLGSGVCLALATRWAISELKKESWQDMTDVLNNLKIGNIDARDRLNQAFYQISRNEDLEKFYQNLERKMGVLRARTLNVKDIPGKEALTQSIKKLISNQVFAIQSNGVGRLGFGWREEGVHSAHAITICCQENSHDPAESVFRIIDPNYGALQFKVKPDAVNGELAKKEFIDCLSDLLLTYANQIIKLSCRCFELK